MQHVQQSTGKNMELSRETTRMSDLSCKRKPSWVSLTAQLRCYEIVHLHGGCLNAVPGGGWWVRSAIFSGACIMCERAGQVSGILWAGE